MREPAVEERDSGHPVREAPLTEASQTSELFEGADASSRRARASGRPLVDIVGIGVQKAATSWLFACLREHPEIRAAVGRGHRKELNFFNRSWEQGFDSYERLFRPGPWRNLEFSTLYFHDANVPERLRSYNPDAKLLLSLRNPVDRAFSHHRHEYARGRLPKERRDFWDALSRNPSYIELGKYATHLSRWLRWFPEGQLHVVFHEEISSDPAGVLGGIFRFVGVDPTFRPPSTTARVNEAVRARIGGFNRWLRLATGGLRAALGDAGYRTFRATGLGRTLRKRNRVRVEPSEFPPLGRRDRARLAELFAAENERLARMLDRDLSLWAS